MIYTTNAVEALHRPLRKIIKARGSFRSDHAALKLLYLAVNNAGMHWRRPVEWTGAMSQFAVRLGERFPEQGDDDHSRHRDTDYRLARNFAVKPGACGAALRGFGA